MANSRDGNCGGQVGVPTENTPRSINTRTGGEDHHITDLAFPGLCGRLEFTRFYSSIATNIYTTTLGYGWTHNLDTRLILPNQPGGVAGQILFKFQNANQLIYFDEGNGTYSPYPGVLGALTQTTSPAGFQITLPDQRVYLFDTNGRLLSMRDAQNHTRSYIYTNNLLTRVEDETGARFLNLAYDGQNRLQTVSDPLGRAAQFGYDANGDLTTVIDARGKTWTYAYDGAHRLTEYINPLGQTVMRIEYDAQGRAAREFDGLNNKTVEIVYNTTDGLDGTRTVTDALGNVTTASYDWRGTLIGLQDDAGVTQKTYDANFRPARVTDPNNRATQLTWDNTGRNLTRLVDARGMTTTLSYDLFNNLTQTLDVLGRANTFEYEGTLLKRSTDALNNTTTYTYTVEGFLQAVTDARGNTTSYTYNPFGQRTSMTDALNRTTTYEYDAVGRLTKTTDALGRVTRSEYDNGDHLIRVTQNYRVDKGVNEDNQYNIITEYGYDDAGRRTTITDALGRVTLNEYNANGQLIKVTQNYRAGFSQNAQNEYNLVTLYEYDAQGRQIAVTDTLGRVTRNEYDSANRLFRTTQNYLAGQPRNEQNQYNIVTEYGYDAAGNVLSTTDTFGRMTVTLYDELNRPYRSIVNYQDGVYAGSDPDQDLITETTYDAVGNVSTTTDVLGRVTRNEYDALNRLTRVTVNYDANRPQNDANQYNLVTEYVYDAAGNRIRVIDTLGRITRTEYDALNRAFRVTENLLNGQPQNYQDEYNLFTTFTFDDVGNRIRVTDTLGRFTQTEYDALNRVSAQIDAAGGQTSFGYDAGDDYIAAIAFPSPTQIIKPPRSPMTR